MIRNHTHHAVADTHHPLAAHPATAYSDPAAAPNPDPSHGPGLGATRSQAAQTGAGTAAGARLTVGGSPHAIPLPSLSQAIRSTASDVADALASVGLDLRGITRREWASGALIVGGMLLAGAETERLGAQVACGAVGIGMMFCGLAMLGRL